MKLKESCIKNENYVKKLSLDYDILVDGKADEQGNCFKSVGKALEYAQKLAGKAVIYVKNGIYKEKLAVTRPDTLIVGESALDTVITFDDCAGKPGANGEPMGTFNSATMSVLKAAERFCMYNITVENTYDRVKEPMDGGQAVALRVDADKCIFENVVLTSDQDTLYANTGRHYFYNCYIEGDVDFIFGQAQSVFENCDIVSDDRDNDIKGYIAAPRTELEYPYGYLILNCRLLNTIKNPSETVYLARPWRRNGSVAFINCYMQQHIKSEGYTTMGKDENKNYPENARFFEYGSYGEGAKTSPTRKLADKNTIAHFTKQNVWGNNNNMYKDTWLG